jgi:hypothetical protein
MTETKRTKKFFSVEEANKMLPLIRSILRDIIKGHKHLGDVVEKLRQKPADEELKDAAVNARDDLQELLDELHKLGVELKGIEEGIVDFPHLRDGQEVFLCWHVGEEQVGHWHEIKAGFEGRKPL